MSYEYKRTVDQVFENVDHQLRQALKEQGFGIITEIDVKYTLKDKLGVEFKKYTILGACNPPIAHQALSSEPEIGLLLPCNVVLWENEDNTTTIAAIDATKMLSITGRDDLDELAENVNAMLKSAVDAV